MFGCEVIDVLHKSARSTIYRARRHGAPHPLVLKVASDDASTIARMQTLQREARILGALASVPGVISSFGLQHDRGAVGLLLEYGGDSFTELGLAGTLPLPEALTVAVSLADILAAVHRSHVVHMDLHPGNLLLGADGGSVRLIDFGSATLLPGELKLGSPVNALEGALAYMSPEQTGQLNRALDHRTDLYSLGITLFELLTGVLPFNFADPLELVHAHVARPAPNVRELNPEVPPMLSGIIAKLLSKDADDRYQSADSLRTDLATCQDDLLRGDRTTTFALAQGDQSARFQLRQRLYGRELAIAQLESAFERTCRGSTEVVTITGPAGIGKSALAHGLVGAVRGRRGRFASGKFLPDAHGMPYAAIAHALDALAVQLLVESEETLATIRAAFGDRLGAFGGVLLDLCPTFERVLGPQGEVPVLPIMEAQTRLHQAFACCLDVMARSERPLCLFLDDLQWADRDSITLLAQALCADRGRPLLAVFAYRPQDLSEGHPLRRMLGELVGEGVPVEQLELEPLMTEGITTMIAESIGGVDGGELSPLAQLVRSRTGGNPLLVRELLGRLSREGAISVDVDGFHWDRERAQQMGVGRDTIDLLLARFGHMPATTQQFLQRAACLGSRFELEVLRAISDDGVAPLWPAIEAELIVPCGRLHSLEEIADPSFHLRCAFAHDRIHQAVLSTVPAEIQERIHLETGRVLLASGNLLPATLFDIAAHYNRALSHVECEQERLRAAFLNLDAGRQALQRAAGAEALELARAGLSWLGRDPWNARYELARDLHLLAGDAAFWADRDAALVYADSLMDHARFAIDAAQALRLKGRVRQGQARPQEAIALFRTALHRLATELPESPTEHDVGAELRRTAEALRGHEVEDLLILSRCEASEPSLAMELLSRLIFFTYASNHPLFPLAICRLVRLSLEHGNTPHSANGYTFYGVLLSRDHDLERAHRFGQLALDLAQRCGDRAVLSQTQLYANYQIMHWKVPLGLLSDAFRIAHRLGIEAGSPANAACSATTLCICRFWAGDDLAQLQLDLEKYRENIVRLKQTLVLNWHEVLLQLVLNLRWDRDEPGILAGPVYDEAAREPHHRAAGDHSSLFNLLVAKTYLGLLFGARNEALAAAEQLRSYRAIFATALWALPVVFVESLCRLAAARDECEERRDELLKQVAEDLDKLRGWSAHNPSSVVHKLRALEAGFAQAKGQFERARALYAEAAEHAHASGMLHEEAMICELAARLNIERDDHGGARSYLRRAYRAYQRWGALSKVRALEREYPSLLSKLGLGSSRELARTGRDAELDAWDVLSVLQASQAISSEIKLEQLLSRLMVLLIEVSGAESGYLLLPRDGQWSIEVAHTPGAIVCSGDGATEGSSNLVSSISWSIVNYVARTGEAVLSADARSAPFERVLEPGARRSLLCFALKRQGETVALAYLENSLAPDIFTRANLRVLELLSAQAVVSLENARLYDQLERKVATRTRELQQKNEELESALLRVTEMRRQLVTQEKLAALGALTAGIAHEIKNPLNFVTNFAQVSGKVIDEVLVRAAGGGASVRLDPEALDLLQEVKIAVGKIGEHGARATAIINGMALHAHGARGDREPADLNYVVLQSVSLAFHSWRGESSEIRVETLLDPSIDKVEMVVQDVSRVFVNLLVNSQHAVQERLRSLGSAFFPQIIVTTIQHADTVEVRFWDNGIGIEAASLEKIFLPFFTTKPPGQGTGLGLSLSHDIIVRGHGGDLRVESEHGEFTEFVVTLPRRVRHGAPAAPLTS